MAVTEDGDLANLVCNEGAVPGSGGQAVDHAVTNGATWLNAFDGWLPEPYRKHGFTEQARLKWSDDASPDVKFKWPLPFWVMLQPPQSPGTISGDDDQGRQIQTDLADALLGMMGEDGDILWSGSPRSMYKKNPTDSPTPSKPPSQGTSTPDSSPDPPRKT